MDLEASKETIFSYFFVTSIIHPYDERYLDFASPRDRAESEEQTAQF